MKTIHFIAIRVFSHEDKGDDTALIIKKLTSLFPFDLEKEKIVIKTKKAEGFADKIIIVFTVMLTKDRHVNGFLSNLAEKLGDEAKTIIEQVDSRVDDELNLFIRLDKEMMMKDKYVLTDSGNCYHLRVNLAAFPKKKEKAAGIVSQILNIKHKQYI